MKVAIIADLHFGVKKSDLTFQESQLRFFKCQFVPELKEQGVDTIVVCGDIFDRGDETVKVYTYLKSIPKKRCILIKGNHESLYKELLNKTFPDKYDFSNGTVRAFCNIAGIDEEKLSRYYWLEKGLPLDYEQIEERLYST